MSKPQRRREDGAVDFFGGPRDGDRFVVEGTPATFSIPEEVRHGKKKEVCVAIYRFEGGAYHYVGQGREEED